MAIPPRPDRTSLHNAALAHLARFATTRQGLTRVLDRRIARWARAAEGEAEEVAALRAEARTIVAKLVALGAIDDAAFAAARARSLTRAGRSRAVVAAHLAARGVAAEQARAAIGEDAQTQLAAALVLARRRRLGPFRDGAADARRELGVLARAGFGQDTAERALAMEQEAALALIAALKRS